MGETAPQAIWDLYNAIKAGMPEASMLGIIGDSAHSYGYHKSRNWILAHGRDKARDYSVQYDLDKSGDGDAASALDVGLPPAQMKLVSRRMMEASQRRDPRLKALREWFGTENGADVIGFDFRDPRTPNDDTFATSDASHRWHVHLSVYRHFACDKAALLPIADVMLGKGAKAPAPVAPQGTYSIVKGDTFFALEARYGWPEGALSKLNPGVDPRKLQIGQTINVPGVVPKPVVPAWPLPKGHYFGLITGPTASHGGYYPAERPHIQRLQQQLIRLGHVPGITNPASAWADGIFERPTSDAVARWQRAKWATYTTRYGEVWADDWDRIWKEKA